MKRVVVGVVLGAVIALAAFFGWVHFSDSRNRVTIEGNVIVTDPVAVYTPGTPDAVTGVVDGCSGYGLSVGTAVSIEDTQGKTVATGKITSSQYEVGEPEIAIDRSNHGCGFYYVVKGVPKLPAYDIVLGYFIDQHDIAWDKLEYFDQGKGVFYMAPLFQVAD